MKKCPPGTSEQMHFHKRAEQFFYILQGKATFTINEKTLEAFKGEGIYIAPGALHNISNNSSSPLEFLLISQPSTKNGDRFPA